MGVRSYFEQVDPSTLRPCPRNKHVFGPTEDELTPEFLASIKEDGVLAPIIVNSKRMICDGHRRTAAAVKMGLKSVPCYVSDHEDIDKTLHAWDTLQKQVRVRTKEQTARLFGQYKAEEAEQAATAEKTKRPMILSCLTVRQNKTTVQTPRSNAAQTTLPQNVSACHDRQRHGLWQSLRRSTRLKRKAT